jgi:hypothetical protein
LEKEKKELSNITINISNKEIKYKQKHGVEFKDMLDARDVVMEFDFAFDLHFDLNSMLREDYSFEKC